MTDSPATTAPEPLTAKPLGPQKHIGWGGWLLFGILVIFYVGVARSITSNRPLDGGEIVVVALATGAAGAYFSSRRGRRAWRGFVIGLVIGCVVCLVAAIAGDVASRVRGRHLTETLPNAVSALDPVVAERLRF
jgi:hypothetical protein